MKMQIIGRIMFLNMVCGIMCLMACHQPVTAPKTAVRHMAAVSKNGSILYVDRADSRQVMKTDSGANFIAFRIGFTDSLAGDAKYEQERNVYYDFRMANDWKAVVGKDSLAPVFFQPVTGLNKMNKEGILVFEMPAGEHPDVLVYNDSFGDWQKQIIALNPHLK